MVGTGRFELPTPRTPSECSTRLSHVPTRQGSTRNSLPEKSVRGRHILLGQRRSLTEKVLVHLLHQKLLRLGRPRLQAILIEQHLLVLQPLHPGLLRDVVIDLVAEIAVEGRLLE